ncbi:hypothetical protein EA085_26080 [Salmonella enterica subsp. enterica serovar Give]|nr:hypothetical protein [Salmonella enterica subsp. enterica serovar Give]
MPDTASYATQAIRYNTVTVQVNGANIGTEYHAAWSPDIYLNRLDTAVYDRSDTGAIVYGCSSPIIYVYTGAANDISVYGERDADWEGRCAVDPATQVKPRVAYHSQALTAVNVQYSRDEQADEWAFGDEINKRHAAGYHFLYSPAWALRFTLKATGGAAILGHLSLGLAGTDTELKPNDSHRSPRLFNVKCGLLTDSHAGKETEWQISWTPRYKYGVKPERCPVREKAKYPDTVYASCKWAVYKTGTGFGFYSLHDMSVTGSLSDSKTVYTRAVLKSNAQASQVAGAVTSAAGAAIGSTEVRGTQASFGRELWIVRTTAEVDDNIAGPTYYEFSKHDIGEDNNVTNPHYSAIRIY